MEILKFFEEQGISFYISIFIAVTILAIVMFTIFQIMNKISKSRENAKFEKEQKSYIKEKQAIAEINNRFGLNSRINSKMFELNENNNDQTKSIENNIDLTTKRISSKDLERGDR